jgi:hypothetical protein
MTNTSINPETRFQKAHADLLQAVIKIYGFKEALNEGLARREDDECDASEDLRRMFSKALGEISDLITRGTDEVTTLWEDAKQ